MDVAFSLIIDLGGSMMSDLDLLKKAQHLDCQAWAEIYDRYSERLYAYAYRLLGDPCLAEDCVAETFHRCLTAVRLGGGPKNHLQAYLYRIAHNLITDCYRQQPPPPLSFDDYRVSSDTDVEREAIQELTCQQVRTAMAYLTDDQRQVVCLKFYEGWENAEIAAALDKPVGAVKSLQVRALAALRRLLEDRERDGFLR